MRTPTHTERERGGGGGGGGERETWGLQRDKGDMGKREVDMQEDKG